MIFVLAFNGQVVGISGRLASQIITTIMMVGAVHLTHKGALLYSSMNVLASILSPAIHFARRGTARCVCHWLIKGPKRGCLKSQSCSFGQPLEEAHTADSRKTVVGKPGRMAPIKASPTKNRASKRQNAMINIG